MSGDQSPKPKKLLANVLLNLSRRDVMIGIGSALAGGPAWNAYDNFLKNKSILAENREFAKELLLGDGPNYFYRTATNNPYSYATGTTAPTRDALNSVMGVYELDGIKFTEVDRCIDVDIIDGTLVLLGGPVSNMYSRQILGVGDKSYLFSSALKKSVNLPIYFENILSAHPSPGHKPNYRIVFDGRRISCNTVDTNYLVITSFPNVFSPSYGVFNHRILVLSGLNGSGTRAIKNIIENPTIVNILHEKSKNYDGWQALIKITRTDATGQFPLAVGGVKVLPLHLDYDTVRKNVEHECFLIDPHDPLIEADRS
ncbi:MAG: hypothetical protein WC689_13470 [Methylocystis sp.]|jgi:hypothetical protein